MSGVSSRHWAELVESLPAVAMGPLTYNPPQEDHGHWSITDASGRELACPHTPPSPELIRLLVEGVGLMREAAADARHNTTSEARHKAPAHRSPVERSRDTPEDSGPVSTPTPLEVTTSGYIPVIAPRPAWNLRPLWKVSEFLESKGMTFGEIVSIVTAPEGTEPGRNGATIYVGEGLRVVVANDNETVLAVYPVGKQQEQPQDPKTGPPIPRMRGTKSDKRIPIPNDRPSFIALLHSRGFDLIDGGKHQRIVHEGFPGIAVTIPTSPSDYRWAQNTVSDIKLAFGIDLRQPPTEL